MSRRTFPRAAAGLVAAALGTPATASAQAPNPWRGETAALPTAPSPRAVAAPHTRQIILGVGYNHLSGLTGTVQIRPLASTPVAPVAPAPRVVTFRPVCVDLDIVTGPCPCPTQLTAQAVATPGTAEVTFHTGEPVVPNTLKAIVTGATTAPVVGFTVTQTQALPTPRYLEHYPQYFPPEPVFPLPRELVGVADPDAATRSTLKPVVATSQTTTPAAQPASYVTPASYAAPVTVAAPRYMPPPAPLPLPRVIPPIPPADGFVPLQVEGTFPEKGVRPVWTPTSNAVPHGRLQSLESSLPTATRAAQAQQ